MTTTHPDPGTHRGQGVWQSDDLARIASLFLTLHLALCEKVETHGDGVGILEARHFAKGNRDVLHVENHRKNIGDGKVGVVKAPPGWSCLNPTG